MVDFERLNNIVAFDGWIYGLPANQSDEFAPSVVRGTVPR
jgi:hypothetical protein